MQYYILITCWYLRTKTATFLPVGRGDVMSCPWSVLHISCSILVGGGCGIGKLQHRLQFDCGFKLGCGDVSFLCFFNIVFIWWEVIKSVIMQVMYVMYKVIKTQAGSVAGKCMCGAVVISSESGYHSDAIEVSTSCSPHSLSLSPGSCGLHDGLHFSPGNGKYTCAHIRMHTCTHKHAHTQTHAHTQRHTQPHTQACTCACMNCISNVCLSTCSICIVPIGTDYLCQAKFIQPLSGQYTKSLSLRLINSWHISLRSQCVLNYFFLHSSVTFVNY